MTYRDAHTHLSAGACDLADLDVRAVRATGELAKAVARASTARAPGTWIRAWGWSGEMPAGELAPDHPVWLTRSDGHAAWLNAAAQRALALPAVVEEAAFDEARRRLPPLSDGEREAAVLGRVAELSRLGFGAVDDMVEEWGARLWGRLAGRLEIGLGLWIPAATPPGEARRLRRIFPPEGRPVALRGVKIFLDGTLAARTAALSVPYADAPDTRGALRMSPAALTEAVLAWSAQGFPVAIHAIGDRAVATALHALERAPRPAWGAHRIEHAQVVARGDLSRFARAGIVASLQPTHAVDDRSWLPARLAPAEGVIVHGLASFLVAGVRVVLGSDWPVASWDPEAAIAACADPERGSEAISREEAGRLLSP